MQKVGDMDIQNEIIQAIDILIQKRLPTTRMDIPTVVLGVEGDKYRVNIDGIDYNVKDGVNINPTIGTKVWLHCPNGKINQAYIAAKR